MYEQKKVLVQQRERGKVRGSSRREGTRETFQWQRGKGMSCH